ncbi:hypothetical protein [Streptomyces longwoodensis]|uniref:hypothetical protein n=1 Tax=Streptomyces longwoodensis TaxID=68231 RepID=UPI000A6E41C9|nr:hypothetical protein [Streptomyces longwoodensis]
MANLADEYGTDVEIYIKALTTTIHADTPTGAPAKLHDLLEMLGLERHAYPTDAPLYIWHTVPEHLDADEQKRLATRAIPRPAPGRVRGQLHARRLRRSHLPAGRARHPHPYGPPCRAATGTGRLPLAPRTGPPYPVIRPVGPGTTPEPPGHRTARFPEKPVATRTPLPISDRLKPRLATALFRRYLRACIPADPDRASPLAGARPEAVLAETQRVGQRHHH